MRGEREHGTAFVRQGPETRTATCQASRAPDAPGRRDRRPADPEVGGSAFDNFIRDEFTTLPETRDRILATSMTATWRYASDGLEFDAGWHAVRRVLLETFAEHERIGAAHAVRHGRSGARRRRPTCRTSGW
jgi:urate oxidase